MNEFDQSEIFMPFSLLLKRRKNAKIKFIHSRAAFQLHVKIPVLSSTRKSVSSDIQTLRSGLKKRGTAEFFLVKQHKIHSFFLVFDTLYITIGNRQKASIQIPFTAKHMTKCLCFRLKNKYKFSMV